MNEQEIRARQAEQRLQDEAGIVASSIPFPGPARDAFLPLPPIKVGQFEIREFCDADFEALQVLENPLLEFVAGTYDSKEVNAKDGDTYKRLARGQHAWNLCMVMTTAPQETDAALRTNRDKYEQDAKLKFGLLRAPAIAKLVAACIDQFTKSFETHVDFDAASGAPENEEVASSSRPPMTA